MKLIQHKNKYLRYAQNVVLSSEYVFLLTGKRVVILDSQFEYVSEITGLDYVYDGYLSNDESILWLVSDSGFLYCSSTKDFNVKKIKIPGEYSAVDGMCCSSKKNGGLYVSLTKSESGDSFSNLRKYTPDGHYVSLIEESDEIYISHLYYAGTVDKYLLICRKGGLESDYCELIWYDEKYSSFERYKINGLDDLPDFVEVDETSETIYFKEYKKAYDYQGNTVKAEKRLKKSIIAKMIEALHENDSERLNKLISALLRDRENINDFCVDKEKNILYIGTNICLYAIDLNDFCLIGKTESEVLQMELYNNKILISTGCGACIYSLENE